MRLRQILLATGLVAALMMAAKADEVAIELKPINSTEECNGVLGVFAWACANFDDPSWRDYIQRLDGEDKRYWEKYSAAAAMVDLDGDGELDLILQVVSSLTCGMRNCDTHFLFSDRSTSELPFSYEISGPYRPASILLRYTDGKSEIRFQTGSKWFDVTEMKLGMREMWTFK